MSTIEENVYRYEQLLGSVQRDGITNSFAIFREASKILEVNS